ncbi:unnamed protein product [Camellia sinensis]
MHDDAEFLELCEFSLDYLRLRLVEFSKYDLRVGVVF